MKKIIILILVLLASKCMAQAYTFTSDGDTIKASTILGTIKGTSYTNMSSYCQYYRVAIKVNNSTDSVKVCFDAALTNYFYTVTSPKWNYIGFFNSVFQNDLWFLPPNGASVTVKFDEFVGIK